MVGLAHRVLVADHHRSLDFIAELQERVLGIASQHEANTAFAGAFSNVRNTLRQERVMSQVGVGIKRHRREENHHRLLQSVSRFYRYVESGIIQRPLRTLHPVDDAAARGIGRAVTADRHTWIGR